MDMERVVITDEQELTLRRRLDELKRRTLEGTLEFDVVANGLDALTQAPPRDLAEEWRAEMEKWYRGLGFTELAMPKPAVSNREFGKRAKAGQALFYRPATAQVSYEAFMTAKGQGQHWTVIDSAERAKIVWEPAAKGYWFWAEVPKACPRLKMPWNSLTKAITLLALEEYVVVWWAMKAQGTVLDKSTWTWLRTRHQVAPGRLCPGRLRVRGQGGRRLGRA